jgi:two-component system sensor histidine kinase DctS
MNSPLPSARSDAAERAGHPSRWQWYAYRAAIGLIVAAVLGLLWVLERQEIDESRGTLIRDSLWIEQNVQFSLERSVEHLRQLAQDSRGAEFEQARLEARVGDLLPSNPGLVQVLVLDASGAVRASAPAPATKDVLPFDAASVPAYQLARTTGNPTFGPPHLLAREHAVAVFVPYYRGGALAGTVVGVHGLKSMLAGLVPWWLAEKHRVTIRDAAGNVLAAKSNVEAHARAELTHQGALDPPGHGLVLHVESYGSETKLVRNVLAITIVGLAAAVLWSMWSLRRHVQRRVDIEHALRREHAFRKAMEDSLETGMRAVDLEGRIIYVNPAFCRMVGFTEAELIGHPMPPPYWPAEDVSRFTAILNAARDGSPRKPFELELVRRDGTRFDSLTYEAPLVDAQGRQTGWMGSVVDITERKRARELHRQQEEKLAATARLVTMGEMASAIAHELNQPLSAIASYTTGCLNLLAIGAATPPDLKDALSKTSHQAQRAGHIIRRVHEFVRKSEPTRTRVRLGSVLEEAVGFAQADARNRRVRVSSRLSGGDLELDADPVLLQQVLLNLMRNGMEAMAGTAPEQRELTVTATRADGWVTVSVADRGCGLSPEVREQLFEPFFTTKPEGMGMGLNICRSIIEMHRGRVWADSAAGGGTVFSFSLPLEIQ